MYAVVCAVVVEMFCRCQPAYIKYSIFGLPERRSEGLQHEENLYWDDINVIFAGIFVMRIL